MSRPIVARRRGVRVVMRFAWKTLPTGQIAQTVVTRTNDRPPMETVTGRYYRTTLEATQDVARLNRGQR